MKLKFWIFILVFSVLGSSQGQVKFQIEMEKYSDSFVYYIRNIGKEQINGNAINCYFFHMRDGLVFWPTDLSIGVNANRFKGDYPGKKYNFKRRTLVKMGFDFFLDSGQRQSFVTAVNYIDTADTLMLADIDLYTTDTAGKSQVSHVFFKNQTPCNYNHVYALIGSTDDGLKFGSAVNTPISYSPSCFTQLSGVIVQKDKLEITYAPGIKPKCADGRKHTYFGYPKDENVFYSFDLRDSIIALRQIDTWISAIRTGDYVFMATTGKTDFKSYPWLNNALWKSTLAKIGVQTTPADPNYPISTKLLVAGQKDLSVSKNKGVYMLQPTSKISDFFLLPNGEFSSNSGFTPCAETQVDLIDKYVPEIPESIHQLSKIKVKVYPNPTEDMATIYGANPLEKWQLYDLSGRTIETQFVPEGNGVHFSMVNASPGTYFVRSQYRSTLVIKN